MRCPRCRSTMREEEVKDTSVRRCIACRGTWVTIDALAAMLPGGKTGKTVERDFDRALANGDRDYGSLRCPACEATPLIVANVRHVEIDICEGCYGVFFDAGEVGRVTISRYLEPRHVKSERVPDAGGWALDIVGLILSFLSGGDPSACRSR